MDLHILWLRRFVIGRVLVRLVAESTALAFGVGAVLAVSGVDWLGVVAVSLLTAPIHVVFRVGTAITSNPLDHRFLMAWRDQSSALEPMPEAGRDTQPHDRILAGIGLEPLARLGINDGVATTVAYEVYRSPSKLVLVTVEAESGLTMALSRMTDDRILVTCEDFTPPGVEVLVNTAPKVGEDDPNAIADLVMHHVGRLDELKNMGLLSVPAGPELVAEQVRLEWRGWQFIGPFVGPLLAIDQRRIPHLLRVQPPRHELWERGLATETRHFIRYRFKGPTPPQGAVSRAPEITVNVPHQPLRRRVLASPKGDR